MLYEIDENKKIQPLEFYNVGDLNKNENYALPRLDTNDFYQG